MNNTSKTTCVFYLRNPSWLKLCPPPVTGASVTLKRQPLKDSWKRRFLLLNCECTLWVHSLKMVMHCVATSCGADVDIDTHTCFHHSQVTDLNSRLHSATERSHSEREELVGRLHHLSTENASAKLDNQKLKVPSAKSTADSNNLKSLSQILLIFRLICTFLIKLWCYVLF